MSRWKLKFSIAFLGLLILLCLSLFRGDKYALASEPLPEYSPVIEVATTRQLTVPFDETAATTEVGNRSDLPVLLERRSTKQGYAMAVDYYEQQTAGARDMQDLQCWAAQYNLSVVEPVVSNSYLVTPLNVSKTNDVLRFSDFYDIDDWNSLSLQSNHAMVKDWHEFLANAPRQQVILVSVRYADDNLLVHHSMNRKHLNLALSHSQRITQGCSYNWSSVEQFLRRHRFNVSREVCINFAYGDGITEENLRKHIFASLSPSSSIVIFSQWRAIGPTPRFRVISSSCGVRSSKIFTRALASPGFIPHVRKYQEKYLGGSEYIALHVRLEKVQLVLEERWRKSRRVPQLLDKCLNDVLRTWQELKDDIPLTHTLLAADMGRFATRSLHMYLTDSVVAALEIKFREFFKSVYGDELGIRDWEDSFVEVAGTDDPGYVAALQKMLVVGAKCVVIIGGGSFQSHLYNLYLRSHSNDKQPCIKFINECSYKLEN